MTTEATDNDNLIEEDQGVIDECCDAKEDNIIISDFISEIDDNITERRNVQVVKKTKNTSIAKPIPPQPPTQQRKEIISYQRYGRISRKILANPSYKCHLCGFCCCYKESLLQHFVERHPN